MARRRTARARDGHKASSSQGPALAVLVGVALAIVVAGAAAFVTVPASLVILVLVFTRPNGAGSRVRRWGVWRRVRGLEPTRGRAPFAVALAVYGVVIPGACLSLVVAAARSGSPGQSPASTAADRPTSTGVAGTQSTEPPVPAATDAPTAAPTPMAALPQPVVPPAATDAPTAAPTPMAALPRPVVPPAAASPVDPCHVGGVTYCALNPEVTQATIGSTICVSGWTATVRPPESYTYDLKKRQIAQEGLPGGTRNYEEDHRMPLELGGAPGDVTNLSPESPPAPNPKDSSETSLKYDVCDGRMTLAQAQQQMVSIWLAVYPGYRR